MVQSNAKSESGFTLLIVIGQKLYVHSVTQLTMHLWLQSTQILKIKMLKTCQF